MDSPTLLGIAAIISAIGGATSTILAIRKSRSEEQELCRERLKAARAEAEEAAGALHERRMIDAGIDSARGRRDYSGSRGGRHDSSSNQPDWFSGPAREDSDDRRREGAEG